MVSAVTPSRRARGGVQEREWGAQLIFQPRDPGVWRCSAGFGGQEREVGGPLLSLKCGGCGDRCPILLLGEPGPPGQRRGSLPQLDLEPPGLGVVVSCSYFFLRRTFLGRAQGAWPVPARSPKTTPLSRNRIIPSPWRWGAVAASFRLACASYSWDPPPSPLPSTTPGHFAKSLQDFPDFLPAAPGCGWGGGRQ